MPCFAHRSSTVLETAWKNTREKSAEFLRLTDAVSDLRAFISRSGGIQEKLPKTIKKTSGTRPWRSFYIVNESGEPSSPIYRLFSLYRFSLVLASYDVLLQVFTPIFEENRVLAINKQLLSDVVELMRNFVPIFDSLELSELPTLQNVVPSYYQMMKIVSLDDQERPTMRQLKQEIRSALDEK